jgi:hypothetical protein
MIAVFTNRPKFVAKAIFFLNPSNVSRKIPPNGLYECRTACLNQVIILSSQGYGEMVSNENVKFPVRGFDGKLLFY